MGNLWLTMADGVQKVKICGNPIFLVSKITKQLEKCKIEKKNHGKFMVDHDSWG